MEGSYVSLQQWANQHGRFQAASYYKSKGMQSMGEEILNNFLVKSTPMWMSNGLWSWCLLGAIFRFRTSDGLDVESDASRAEEEFDGSVNLDDQNE